MKKKIFLSLKGLSFLALILISMPVFSQGEKTYTIVNNTGMVVTSVSISPNDSDNWSPDLNTNKSIANDETFEFKRTVDNVNCIYDIRFKNEDGKYYYVQDINLCNSVKINLAKTENDVPSNDNK